jgi:hypothetical protein
MRAGTYKKNPREVVFFKQFALIGTAAYFRRNLLLGLSNQPVMHKPVADTWELPNKLRILVETELNPGEDITWIGSPIPRLFARRALPIVLFGIPWTLFAVFWICGAAGFKMPNIQKMEDGFFLFGIPFVLVGIVMLSSPLWYRYKARRTCYVLTNRRAIVFDGGFLNTTIRSFEPERLHDLRRIQRDDGSGDLVLDRVFNLHREGHMQSTDYGFLAIENVRAVEQLVRGLAK